VVAPTNAPFVVRRATRDDADRIAEAHMNSIHTLGVGWYGPDVIAAWGRPRSGEPYASAMAAGEEFFVAVEVATHALFGFSAYRFADGKHRTAVYVVGEAARRGVGAALFREAERAAREAGATALHVDASLAAVAFYERNGFVALGRGEHRLSTGVPMDCVFMWKALA
jgi:putative acetyltransferase